MKSAYSIILKPYITEKSMALSCGDLRRNDEDVQRKYTFKVAVSANKIEIKKAVEHIYNSGKKDDDKIQVTKVHVQNIKGKVRTNFKKRGKRSDIRKAVVTLKQGQHLDDFGV